MKKRILVALLLICAAVFTASVFDTSRQGGVKKILGEAAVNLTHPEFYYALANPTIAYVNVGEGMRKEQIAQAIDSRFDWSDIDKDDFLSNNNNSSDTPVEGKYFPGVYLVPKDISGEDLRTLMFDRFADKTKDVTGALAKGKINMDTALTIASIIQREAAGKSDMKLISGIIWNRLFGGMSLQMDATVQYAKGTEANGWWPQVTGKDTKISSPYNTYLNKGLPPSPIANPGLAALEAALSPQKTSCFFYIHKAGKIYCSATYAGHVENINKYLKS